MPLLLGCIADDLTGATDLANTLARRGMSVVQTIGVPAPGTALPDAEAIVVALKSRTIPAKEAVALSLQACRIEFTVRYEFSSRTMSRLLEPLFDGIANSMVDAFTRRAGERYGPAPR